MILSFHPCFQADKNISCAGRSPDKEDLAAIKNAEAVILPQGCYESLYIMARENCSNVFPDYDMRFKYKGKTGQAELFKELGVIHPNTLTFKNIETYYNHLNKKHDSSVIEFPFVFKFDWGDEGTNVFLIKTIEAFDEILNKASRYEKTGQKGFLIQEYIPGPNRTLRVVVINKRFISYWRVQDESKPFGANISTGAYIDRESDLDLQEQAVLSAENFSKKTGINLAGFDFIFSSEDGKNDPLFLEINYFFGRLGLGGSEEYYDMLTGEIKNWINNL